MQGDVTSQRRWEAYDKLGTFGIYVIGTVLVIQVCCPAGMAASCLMLLGLKLFAAALKHPHYYVVG
jgi:hypothetical protein